MKFSHELINIIIITYLGMQNFTHTIAQKYSANCTIDIAKKVNYMLLCDHNVLMSNIQQTVLILFYYCLFSYSPFNSLHL